MRVVSRVDPQALRQAAGRRRARQSPDTDGRVIVVHGAKGGVGASVLASNLAAALARHAGPVALVDLALTSADQDLLWNLECRLRVDDVLGSEGHELSDALVSHPRGVRILAGPAGPAEAESVPADAIRPLIEALAERHPYVVVDTSPELSEVTVCALEMAKRVLVPMVPELPTLRGTQRLLSVLDKLGLDLSIVTLCLWSRPSELEPAAIARVLGRPVDWKLPWHSKAVQESVNSGQPLMVSQPRHALSEAVAGLAAHLAGAPVAEESGWRALVGRLRPRSRTLAPADPPPASDSPRPGFKERPIAIRSVGLVSEPDPAPGSLPAH